MAKIIETYEYVVCIHYLSGLFNGDTSGLEDYEMEDFDAFVEALPEGATLDTIDDEEPFFARDEVTGLMADCVTLYAHIIK